MLLLIPCDNPISILADILVKARHPGGRRRPFSDRDLLRISSCGESRDRRAGELRLLHPERELSEALSYRKADRNNRDPLQREIARNKR
jgi:hypothetical protein